MIMATNNLNEAQLLLELINDARLDPMGDAARYITSYSPLTSSNQEIQNNLTLKGVNGTTLHSQFAALAPKEPLAWNDTLAGTAVAHDNLMIQFNQVVHVVTAAGEHDLKRIFEAGYSGNPVYAGENISGQFHSPLAAHAAFM